MVRGKFSLGRKAEGVLHWHLMPRFLLIALMMLVVLRAEDLVDARAILESARLNPFGSQIQLRAQIRVGSAKTPFLIRTGDGAVSYEFSEPKESWILRPGEESPALQHSNGNRLQNIQDFTRTVRSDLVTLEDLALRFLYWKNPRLLGEETIRTRRAWKIEMNTAEPGSPYGAVRVWIDRESLALLRMEGFDRVGRLVKRFEVVSAQRLQDQWMLKQMRIEKLDPETRKILGLAYLEVLGTVEEP